MQKHLQAFPPQKSMNTECCEHLLSACLGPAPSHAVSTEKCLRVIAKANALSSHLACLITVQSRKALALVRLEGDHNWNSTVPCLWWERLSFCLCWCCLPCSSQGWAEAGDAFGSLSGGFNTLKMPRASSPSLLRISSCPSLFSAGTTAQEAVLQLRCRMACLLILDSLV